MLLAISLHGWHLLNEGEDDLRSQAYLRRSPSPHQCHERNKGSGGAKPIDQHNRSQPARLICILPVVSSDGDQFVRQVLFFSSPSSPSTIGAIISISSIIRSER